MRRSRAAVAVSSTLMLASACSARRDHAALGETPSVAPLVAVATSSAAPRTDAPLVTPAASSARAPAPLDAAACAPLELPDDAPPPTAGTLRGLLDLVRDARASFVHVERDFGALVASRAHLEQIELARPLPRTKQVVLGAKEQQNLRFLSYVDVVFDPPPQLRDLARQLDLGRDVGRRPIRAGCTHGRCPSVRLGQGSRESIAYLVPSAEAKLGSRQVAELPVQRLYVPLMHDACGAGAPVSPPVPLADPSTADERDLAVALATAARRLADDDRDESGYQALFSRLGSASYERNEMSRYAWLRIELGAELAAAPACLPGFELLRDRALLCSVGRHRSFVFVGPRSDTHQVFVELRRARGAPERVERIELVRWPR